MRSHSEIVGAADCEQIATLRGASIHTVRSWGQRNSIPAEHWPAFIEVKAATLDELIAGVKPRKPIERSPIAPEADEPRQAAA